MATMTIHALDPEIEKRIRAKSRKERKSLNQTLKDLLAESMGASRAPAHDHRSDFAEFLGIWSEAELEAFRTATADFARVDEEDWQ